jgi:hypothetical protein
MNKIRNARTFTGIAQGPLKFLVSFYYEPVQALQSKIIENIRTLCR